MTLNNPLRNAGFTAIDAASPDFMKEVQKLLEPDLVAQAQSILPYSIVLKNDTGEYVWGFSVLYTFPDSLAPSGNARKRAISPSGGGPADRSRMLAPGASFLITPISGFLASSGDAAGNRRVVPANRGESLKTMIQQFISNDGNGRVEASVEAVIFEDGTLIGPDGAKMVNRVNSKINGNKDLIDILTNLRGEELAAKLSEISKKGLEEHLDPVARSSLTDIEAVASSYYLTARTSAAHLLNILQSQGESDALAHIEIMSSVVSFTETA